MLVAMVFISLVGTPSAFNPRKINEWYDSHRSTCLIKKRFWLK
ncbi:MAG: hypothetical protein ACTSVI_05890 [Promethearchaeota archaeon]